MKPTNSTRPRLSARVRAAPLATLLRRQSATSAIAHSTVPSVDLRTWAQHVATDPATVVQKYGLVTVDHPHPIWPSNIIECEMVQWRAQGVATSFLESGWHHRSSLQSAGRYYYSFAVVLVKTGPLASLTQGPIDHVVTVYLHRRNRNQNADDDPSEQPWFAVVCDPNYTSALSRENRTYAANLYRLGVHVLTEAVLTPRPFVLKHYKNLIELHRCVNTNVCVPSNAGGICFAGVCASLEAARAYCYRHNIKAQDGTELVDLILKASAEAREVAPWFVAGVHLGLGGGSAPRALGLLMSIGSASRRCRSKDRSTSPFVQRERGEASTPSSVFSDE